MVSRRYVETLRRAVCELKKSREQLTITQGARSLATAFSVLKESSELQESRSRPGPSRSSRVSCGAGDSSGWKSRSCPHPTVGSNPRRVHQTAKLAMPPKKGEGLVRARGGDLILKMRRLSMIQAAERSALHPQRQRGVMWAPCVLIRSEVFRIRGAERRPLRTGGQPTGTDTTRSLVSVELWSSGPLHEGDAAAGVSP